MAYILEALKRIFPAANLKGSTSAKYNDLSTSDSTDVLGELLNGDDFDDKTGPCIYENLNARKKKLRISGDDDSEQTRFMDFVSSSFSNPSTFRPRLLITGHQDQGHSSHLAPAILHQCESMPVHCLDLPTLYAVSAKTPEESCAQVFREARRTAPSVIFMPHICQWWQACTYTLQATFLTLLQDLPPCTPILLLATADCLLQDIPSEVRELFIFQREVYTMRNPTSDERREFFSELVLINAAKPPPMRKETAAKVLEVLPVALPPVPRQLTNSELEKLSIKEEATLRELRIFLRDVLERIIRDKKFRPFLNPVDPSEVEDYYAVIKTPMDLLTMVNKVNLHKYNSAKEFLKDIELISRNALEYNPDTNPSDRLIRSRACELKDTAYAIIDVEMDSDFEQHCIDIHESRSKRGDTPTKTAPTFYRTLPQLEQEEAQRVASQSSSSVVRRYPFSFHEQLGGQGMGRTPATLPKKKKRRLRSSWSRGFIKKPKKKPLKTKEDEEEGNEDEEKDEESGKEKNAEDEIRTSQESEVDKEEEKGNRGDDNIDENNTAEENSNDFVMTETNNDTSNEGFDSQGKDSKSEKPLLNGVADEDSEDNDACSIHSEPSFPRFVSKVNHKHSTVETSQNVVENNETCIPSHSGTPSGGKEPQFVNGDCEYEVVENGDLTNEDSNDVAQVTEHTDSQVQNGQVNSECHTGEGQEDVSPRTRRLTRRMAADIHTQRALEILSEPIPPLVVDKERLQVLLNTIVTQTTNWTVTHLEKLHCSLSQCVYRHKMDYDKLNLTEEMEQEVAQGKIPSPSLNT